MAARSAVRSCANRTFFFGAYQRWTDLQLGAGNTLNGAPTEAGRAVLQSVAGSRPQVAALLEHMQPAQTSTGQSVTFTVDGVTHTVPIGSTDRLFDDGARQQPGDGAHRSPVLVEPHADGPVPPRHTRPRMPEAARSRRGA